MDVSYIEDIADIFPSSEAAVKDLKFESDEPGIDSLQFDLAIQLIGHFEVLEEKENFLASKNRGKSEDFPKKGAVLIFLPGLADITELYFLLEKRKQDYKWSINMLHSELPWVNQRKVFEKVPEDTRKIILSTNIAESSITVTDVVYVIDFCLSKEMACDKGSAFQQLKVIWASKSNCEQRKGRAGRVREGLCYRLVSRAHYKQLPDHATCELLRAPLEKVILQIKTFNMGSPKDILGIAIEQPGKKDIEASILSLKHMGALSQLKFSNK